MNENNVGNNKKESFTAKSAIYFILGILEVLLAFRLVFKLLGANPNSGFVAVIYSITKILLIPFTAIFKTVITQGIETKAVLEPSTIIAMVVYALVAWGIVKLIVVIRGQNESHIQP